WSPPGTYQYWMPESSSAILPTGYYYPCTSSASCPVAGDGTTAADYQCHNLGCWGAPGLNGCFGSTCTSDAACGVGRKCISNGCFNECIDSVTSTTDDMKMHFTFNTPVGVPAASQCGRVVYSDFHVSASALSGLSNFPGSCNTGTLSNQEKALEF